jgi:UDP-glucose:(heptosyl)LPS alpha-1,3-glucosyltransferase
VFAPQARTRILLIAEPERTKFQAWYGTPPERFIALPPGISRDRIAGADAAGVRQQTRAELRLKENTLVLLQVGSAFRTKGVDRSLRAMAALPAPLKNRVHLLIAGRGQSGPLEKLARRLGLGSQVTFLGARDDVPRLLLAADLLTHPARTENTGTVLLEAMAAGLAVLTTANCGYSGHVLAGQAGLVLPVPFDQEEFDRLLLIMLSSQDLQAWGASGLVYAKKTDIYSMPEKAVDAIEAVAAEKSR